MRSAELLAMPTTNLHVKKVGPFEEATLEFNHQVNVFTGPNNSGKSTLLWVLGELLVYPFTMPAKVLKPSLSQGSLSITSKEGVHWIGGKLPIDPEDFLQVYEKIGYTCYIPAQRHGTNFRSSGPTLKQDIDAYVDEHLELYARERSDDLRRIGLEQVRQNVRQFIAQLEQPEFVKRRRLMLAGNSLVSDKAVQQRIINLDYAANRRNKPAIRTTLNQIATIASEITEGFPIQFKGVVEDEEGLYPQFQTPDGDLPLDVLSQGTQSIIQFVARLLLGYAEYYDFPEDLEDKQGILIIDELDAHLHPSWQRRIIPTLTQHFPNVQIFCSTHSPLMLSGLKQGQVQLLRRDVNNKVTVSVNESDIAGWTSDEILREFLGVSDPTDAATASRLSRLQELMREEELSDAQAEELELLRPTVRDDLLRGPTSAQVIRFAEELKRIRDESTHQVSSDTGDEESSRE